MIAQAGHGVLCMHAHSCFLCPTWGHYVFQSVLCMSVPLFDHPSVPIQVKVFGQGGFDEVGVQST